jgi:hypothetical protein
LFVAAFIASLNRVGHTITFCFAVGSSSLDEDPRQRVAKEHHAPAEFGVAQRKDQQRGLLNGDVVVGERVQTDQLLG